ncbi:hypothetical protein Bca4012_006226 [Brassica carinata]|uniref:Uncharacterized protein n=2 Tax=Brassica TaxID=3705 RepID=A0A8X7RPA0_BRACI|nr:hypothetical protein Bca52824_039552 [Brassica carinata]CAF1708457.1 unnamed protein product [Brassica napus]
MYVNVHRHVVSKFIHRYRVEIFVHGNRDKATFVLLGDSGAEPIGRQVSELNYVDVIKFLKNYTTLETLTALSLCVENFQANGSNSKSSNPAVSCDEENKANRPYAST